MNKDRFVEAMLKGIFDANGESPISHSIFAKKVLLLYLKEPENFKKNIYNIDLQEPSTEDSARLESLHEAIPTSNDLQDCRISKMMMHGIRGVGKVDDHAYFGLDCTDNADNPCSMVLIGSNGIGKTSFYSALELIGMGKSNCAKLRGYITKTQQAQFMENINATASDGHILVKTAEGNVMTLKLDEYAADNNINSFIGESCFCSDFDIQTLENYSYNPPENSFTDYIHEQLGLSGFDLVYPILDKYNDEMLRRAGEIRTNTTEILRLKNTVFKLLSERAIIDRVPQRSRLCTDTVKCFRSEYNKSISDIEERILRDDPYHITSEEITLLLNHYEKAITILYDIAYIPKERCLDYFSSIKEAVINGNHFFQTVEDMKKAPDLSFLHHECIGILESALELEDPVEILTFHKESFRELNAFHKLLRDSIENKLKRENLNGRRIEIEKELREVQEDLIKQRMKLIGRSTISMADYSSLIQLSGILKTFIAHEIGSYDQKVYEILKNVVPALCSKSFPNGKGEEVEIRYGETSQVSFASPKKFRLAIKVKLQENDENGNAKYKFEEPGRYLNTFRHKLFCFSLKLALSCCSMKLDNCRYPIMIDDVFDASDFRNRNEICHVMEQLAQQYALLSNSASPLQLILFSQDEIVAERVFKGLTAAENHTKLERLIHSGNYKETNVCMLKPDLSKSKNPIKNWFNEKDWSIFLPADETKRLIGFYRASDNITQNFPYDSK